MDDILVKSVRAKDLTYNLEKTFATLRKYDLKLNRNKCTFSVKSGSFLGYLVTEWGIEANPEKIPGFTEEYQGSIEVS